MRRLENTMLAIALCLSVSAPWRVAAQPSTRASTYLAGTGSGLWRLSADRSGGESSIELLSAELKPRAMLRRPAGWFFLAPDGPWFSPDLARFERRATGLPTKTLLVEAEVGFAPRIEAADLKAIAADPEGKILAVCSSQEIFLSRDSGLSWVSLGSPASSPGWRALGFGPAPDDQGLGLWAAHATRGLFAKPLAADTAPWQSVSAGIPKVWGTNVEEVSGFAFLASEKGPGRFFASTSFLAGIFEWDPRRRSFARRYDDGKSYGFVESLQPWGSESLLGIEGNGLRFYRASEAGSGAASGTDTGTLRAADLPTENLLKAARALFHRGAGQAECMAILGFGEKDVDIVLNEFWRLFPPELTPRMEKALGKKALYLQTSFLVQAKTRAKYLDLMERAGLDSIVLDIKDDSGRLRFVPRSIYLQSMAQAADPLDLEAFSAEAKARGIYLIARLVVFKDKSLYGWKSGALALRDITTGVPWQGVKADGTPIQEHWVDPYSPEVWRYNVEIAKEAASRGFDEIQFDYIRFPTDGANLSRASFPARREGMGPDSALESFLRYARAHIEVPISVDIYGANGFYRTGARTGQDVEMLASYADAICPMFYPSHFEQGFLAQDPPELRPYRIYRLGSSRNHAIARGRALVRPYVQAFYLDVSYDRLYYGPRYVEEELRGIKEGADQGFTFWNNSGRYDDIPYRGP
ncbi:MAG TPA: putative glycoside hydrolase [Rectinemataceae bacterium]